MAKIPRKVYDAAIDRSRVDDYPTCEAQIRLPKSFGATGICHPKSMNVHHRINRSVGGGHALSSLLVLCGSGTVGCHGWVGGNPALAREFGWLLQSTDDPLGRRVLYRGRWAMLTDDGTVYFINEEDEKWI